MISEASVAVFPTDFAQTMLGQMELLSAKVRTLVGEPANEAVVIAAIADVHLIASTISTALGGCGSYTAPSVCILSHEVRNALTAVIGLLEIIKRRPSEGRALMCLKATEHAIALLRGNEECETFSLTELLERSIGFFSLAAEQKGVSLVFVSNGDLPECFSRPTQISQVVYNLIGNAIKFTPAMGSIIVTASLIENDQILISVADTGSGIEDDLLPHLFKARVQASQTAHLGYGLGLSISYNLMQLLGGGIDVETVLGVGTDFRARLPVRCGAVPIAAPLLGRGENMCFQQERKGRGAVLIVEDEFWIRMALSEMLGDLGFECAEAVNVEEAVILAKDKPFELIFVDGLNTKGVALVQTLRTIAHAQNHNPIIVGFSGDNGLAGAQVDDNLRKPYVFADLIALLRRHNILPQSV